MLYRTSLRVVDKPTKALAEPGTIPNLKMVRRMVKRIQAHPRIAAGLLAIMDPYGSGLWAAEPIVRALCNKQNWSLWDLAELRRQLEAGSGKSEGE